MMAIKLIFALTVVSAAEITTGDTWSSTCADRVTCSTVEHLDEHSVLHHVVKVHATSKAEVDKKHWKHICAHELHKETVGAGKCGCECYSESFGFEGLLSADGALQLGTKAASHVREHEALAATATTTLTTEDSTATSSTTEADTTTTETTSTTETTPTTETTSTTTEAATETTTDPRADEVEAPRAGVEEAADTTPP